MAKGRIYEFFIKRLNFREFIFTPAFDDSVVVAKEEETEEMKKVLSVCSRFITVVKYEECESDVNVVFIAIKKLCWAEHF